MFRGNALDQEFGSTEAGLAAMTLHLFRWPVVGEMFVLTTPFIEPPRPSLSNVTLMRSGTPPHEEGNAAHPNICQRAYFFKICSRARDH
jgi:hypothetical protein